MSRAHTASPLSSLSRLINLFRAQKNATFICFKNSIWSPCTTACQDTCCCSVCVFDLLRYHVLGAAIPCACAVVIMATVAGSCRDDRERGIEALPAYVAASTDMLCFETTDYGDRAWCRLERAVAFAFMFSGVSSSSCLCVYCAHLMIVRARARRCVLRAYLPSTDSVRVLCVPHICLIMRTLLRVVRVRRRV